MFDKIKELERQLKEARSGQLFCTYYSPGTFLTETSRYEVETQEDLASCAQRAKVDIKERYNATPFGFRFTDGNGKSLSGMHYLTGKVIRFDEVPDDSEHGIMRDNMRGNNMAVVIENTNSYRFTGNFSEEDVIVDWAGNIVRRGNDADLMAYRAEFKKFRDEYYDSL